jgi:hypothetical protein
VGIWDGKRRMERHDVGGWVESMGWNMARITVKAIRGSRKRSVMEWKGREVVPLVETKGGTVWPKVAEGRPGFPDRRRGQRARVDTTTRGRSSPNSEDTAAMVGARLLKF